MHAAELWFIVMTRWAVRSRDQAAINGSSIPAHDTHAPNATIKRELARIALRQIPPLSENAFKRRLLKSLRAAPATCTPCIVIDLHKVQGA
jgi:hypothetical protein